MSDWSQCPGLGGVHPNTLETRCCICDPRRPADKTYAASVPCLTRNLGPPSPTFDGPLDAIYNRENDVSLHLDVIPVPPDPNIRTVVWNVLSPTSLPAPGQPVLLRLKDRKEITSPKAEAADIGTLLRPGFRYGYTVAVLRYMQDGFKNLFPVEFVAYDFSTRGLGVERPNGKTTTHIELRVRYALDCVEAWMVLG